MNGIEASLISIRLMPTDRALHSKVCTAPAFRFTKFQIRKCGPYNPYGTGTSPQDGAAVRVCAPSPVRHALQVSALDGVYLAALFLPFLILGLFDRTFKTWTLATGTQEIFMPLFPVFSIQ